MLAEYRTIVNTDGSLMRNESIITTTMKTEKDGILNYY